MKKYSVRNDKCVSFLHECSEPVPAGHSVVYLASDVDAFFTAAGFTNWATQAARIAELERILRRIVETAASTSHHANYCVVHRQLLGEARELMVTGVEK